MDTPDFIPDEETPSDSGQPAAQPTSLPSPVNKNWKGSYGVATPDFIPDEQAPQNNAPDFIPDDETKNYSTPGQQALTSVENVAQGALGPIATKGEQLLSQAGVPGISNQDILNRQEANPTNANVSKVVGNIGIMAATPEIAALEKAGIMAKVGMGALDGAIKMGLINAGDEVSKYLLNPVESKSAAAWKMAKEGALGMLTGAVGGAAGSAIGAGAKALAGDGSSIVNSTLAGIAHAMQYPGESTPLEEALSSDVPKELLNPKFFKMGQLIGNKTLPLAAGYAAKKLLPAGLNPEIAYSLGGVGILISNQLEKVLGKSIPTSAKEAVSSAFLKAASSNTTQGLDHVIENAVNLTKGNNMIQKGVKALFNEAPNTYLDYGAHERDREKLKEMINNAPADDTSQQVQAFAEGGHVEQPIQNPIASLYPDQHMTTSTAKGRIMGYLKSIKPVENPTKLPFDTTHRNPQDEREYNKALDLANKPLSILNKIKNGSLGTKDSTHFVKMYPELHQELSKHIHNQIVESQVKEKQKPSYKMRQSLSLFLGTSLDSTLTQQNILAAQSTFINQPPQQPKGSKADLTKMGENAMTPNQSREQRQNKS